MTNKDPEGYSTKVTFIKGADPASGGGWAVRVLRNGRVIDEEFVKSRGLIGPTISSMLRMIDKCGNPSSMASASRGRQWYKIIGEGKP